MTTTTKATVAAGSVAGGALGGAALGGAFNSGSSKQPTTSLTTPNDNTSLQTSAPAPVPQKPQPQKEPDWKPLSLEISGNGSDYENKIGKEYKHLLVGPYGNPDNSNKDWWNKQLTIYNNDKTSNSNNLSQEFSSGKVTSGFAEKGVTSNDPEKALNKVCDSVYKKETSNITHATSTESTDNKVKLRKDLWKYCSSLKTPPKTIEEEPETEKNYEATAYGDTKKSELLSVKDGVNQVLWDLKQKEFFALTLVEDAFFKELHTTKKSNPSANDLKNKCKDAYSQKTANGTTAPSLDNTVKYCSAKAMS